MDIKIQILIGVGILFALIAIFLMVRNRKLELKYALSWIVVFVAIFIVNCFPAITSACAKLVGIKTPINMLFFLGFCFALIIILGLTASVSRLSNKVKKLTQEIAIMNQKIEKLEAEHIKRV